MTDKKPGFIKKINGRIKFLIIILLVYGALWFMNPALFKDAISYFSLTLKKVVPVLGLVFVVLFILNLVLKPEKIGRFLGRESGILGWLYAVIGGILISGPPYILYPMLGELRKHGARNGLIVTLLYNRNVKIQFIPALVYYFGLRYTVVLSVYIILFSVLNGMIFELFVRDGAAL